MENKNTLGNRSHFIEVDMERVYKMLATGLTVDQVALELGISRSTLYRRHREYQRKKQSATEGLPNLPLG